MRYKFFQYPRGVNKGGISRTVKTDDSLAVMEEYNKEGCIQVGNIYPDSENMANRSSGRVYSAEGCSPTILSRDFKQPKMIMEEPILIPEATAKGYAEATEGASVNLEQPSSKTRRGRVGKQMANTLTTSCNQGVVVSEPKALSNTRDSNIVEPLNPYKDGTCRTIKAQYQQSSRAKFARQDGLGATGVVQNRYRIRKLTPRECFRLMDVDEEVIDKIQASGISNSQQYKLAGNSIVVACLEKIFEQMFFPQYTNSRTLFG